MESRRLLLATTAAAISAGAVAVNRDYRRYLAAARARLASVDTRVVTTEVGTVEFADHGSGDPVLVSHGILHP